VVRWLGHEADWLLVFIQWQDKEWMEPYVYTTVCLQGTNRVKLTFIFTFIVYNLQLTVLHFSCASARWTNMGPGSSEHVSCYFHSFKPCTQVWANSGFNYGKATVGCFSISGSCGLSLSGRCCLYWWHETYVGLLSVHWISLPRVGKPTDVLL